MSSSRRSTMRERVKLALRTVEVNFPRMVDIKYAAVREWCRLRQRPFERDFDALRYFPANSAPYLDVGANRGQSCDSIRLCRPDATVSMFEPNPMLATRLADRFGADPHVEVFAFGLSDSSTQADLFVPYYKGWMFDGWASFTEENASSWLPHHIWRFDPRHVRVERTTCTVRPLDELDVDPFFVKIDVQGLEPAVLAGARSTLARAEPILLIENSGPGEVSTSLSDLGYVPYRWDGAHLIANEFGGLNTFFLGPRKRALLSERSSGLLTERMR